MFLKKAFTSHRRRPGTRFGTQDSSIQILKIIKPRHKFMTACHDVLLVSLTTSLRGTDTSYNAMQKARLPRRSAVYIYPYDTLPHKAPRHTTLPPHHKFPSIQFLLHPQVTSITNRKSVTRSRDRMDVPATRSVSPLSVETAAERKGPAT